MSKSRVNKLARRSHGQGPSQVQGPSHLFQQAQPNLDHLPRDERIIAQVKQVHQLLALLAVTDDNGNW